MDLFTTRSASSLESTEVTEKEKNTITGIIIGAAIEVHRTLGPGLLESAYEACLVYELQLRKRKVELINFNVNYLKEGMRRMKS